MSWPALFGLTNFVAVAGWLALLLLPRRPAVHSLVLFGCVGLLCLAYAAMFAALFVAGADAGRVAGAAPPDLTDYSIAGIRSLFMSDGGIVLGWTHYLAFDLFVGLWISRDADAKGFSRWVQLPVLLLTFLAGPIGLLVWLAVRESRARRVGRRAA
jgi:hypothetical protein